MASSYKSTRNQAQAAVNLKLHKGIINFGGDVLKLSTPVTPYKQGDLRIRRRDLPLSLPVATTTPPEILRGTKK